MTIAHFYCAALSFLSGVLVSSLLLLSAPFLTTIFIISVALLLLLSFVDVTLVDKRFIFVGLILLFFSLGGLRVEDAFYKLYKTNLQNYDGQEVQVEGLILSEPTLKNGTVTFFVTLPDTKILTQTNSFLDVKYGDKVLISGTITKPKDFETEFGRTFPYINYLAAKGVLYQIKFADVKVLDRNKGNYIVQNLLTAKQLFLLGIYELLPEPQAGLGAGLLLGVKGSLGDELEDIFRQSGIIHIVVLSGYNVMLVIIFIGFFFERFLKPKVRMLFGIMAIVAFAFLVGLSATVVRASIMAVLLLLLQTYGRTYQVLRGLLVTAVIMLLFNPLLLAFDVGFQLSFLATLGLIIIAPYFEKKFADLPDKINIKSFLVATIATQLMVLPLLLYQIGEVSLVAVLVNVLVLPLVAPAMLAVFLVGLFSIFSSTLALYLSYVAYFILTYIITIATWFSSLSFSTIIVPSFPWWIMFLIYGFGFIAYYFFQYKSVSKTEDMSLSGWTIVEEEMTTIKNSKVTKKVESQNDSTSELPIFFH